MDSLRGETPLDVDEALRTLIDINKLENVLPEEQESISPREIPPTPLLLLASKERSILFDDEQEMDDDDIQTRRYWQKWGKRTAKELVKLIEREEIRGKRQHRREVTYSARTRGPRYYNSESESDSEGTEISLLTCSSLAKRQEAAGAHNKKSYRRGSRGSKVKEDDTNNRTKAPPRVYREGLLGKLMARDASQLSSMLGGQVKDAREEELKMFDEEHRQLLWKVGFTRGIHGKQKSDSTGNIPEAMPKPSKKKTATTSTAVAGSAVPVPTQCRAPSPRYAALQVRRIRRPDSILGIDGHTHKEVKQQKYFVGKVQSASQVRSVFNSRHSANTDGDAEVVKKYQQGLHGLPDFEGKFTKTVREKIKHTVSAIKRKTGHGDHLNSIGQVPQEKGIYTQADYARIPKYPQRVLITPELSSVMEVDIRKRMGRPRFHEIRKKDIRYFDSKNPPLDKANRNLIIFNWLLTNDENNYDFQLEPAIVDLEGEEQNKNYGKVLFHNDIMQRAATALSRVSTAFEDCSTLNTRSRSDFTGDISGLDNSTDGGGLSSGSFSDFSVDND